MADILNTSLSGMRAFQRALEVTSHNIANANTPGYSRQVAEFTTREGQGTGNGFVGTGTQIATVKRIYDAILGEQLQNSTTGLARFETLAGLSGRVDSLLADPNTGLNDGLQSFFNAVQDLANDPASVPTRQALLGEAEGLAGRFRALDARLGEVDAEVNDRIRLAVDDINRLAEAIADVNDKITLTAGIGQPPNDLLDERDRLVLALSEQVSVSTVMQDDGAMNVFIGSGQSLVVGANARTLGTAGGEFDPTRTVVNYVGTAGTTPLDTSLTGGTLGGLLDFRANLLDPARQSLGQTALAFASSFNEQHMSGMDLRGNLGAEFFSVSDPLSLYSASNTGTGLADVTISDTSAFTGADYMLSFDGAAYSLTRSDSGQAVALTGSGTPADPFVADGLSIEVSGAPVAGDRVMIRSGSGLAGSIQTLIADPQNVAMAAPTRSSVSLANTGNASITPARVIDSSDPNLLDPAVIEFTGPATYSINGAGAFAYVEGSPIVVNGSEVTISGGPGVGDQFTVEANFGAGGDNSNGLILAGIQGIGVLEGGSISINENYGRLVSGVGSATRQAQSNAAAQGVLVTNAQDEVLATSAVNLDEEAAKLVRFQQAYQAVAQVVSVASTLFDSLLNATRR
ncbi:MAG: flagellar hook-associated protein FlgK [Pseudomonadota bacterium]